MAMTTITGTCIDRDTIEHTFLLACGDGDYALYLDGSESPEADSLDTLQAMDSATPAEGQAFPPEVGAAAGW